MYPLSSSKIRVVPSSDALFYVDVQILYRKENGICFSVVQLRALVFQAVTLKFSGDTKLAPVELWSKGSMASSSPSSHAALITSEIEKSTKKFITDWNLDNKPSTAKKDQSRMSAMPDATVLFRPASK